VNASQPSNGLHSVVPGAQIQHHGMALGSVEDVLSNPHTGEVEAILVRHGRADYLLRVPARYVRAESSSVVEIDDDVELDEMERTALSSGRAPPTGAHIQDALPTEPAPKAEGMVGESEGMPPTYDGPATG
jgi:sporulation protein YlmC with PRC-barrel domain